MSFFDWLLAAAGVYALFAIGDAMNRIAASIEAIAEQRDFE